MTDATVDNAIRHAIGGDRDAIAWIIANSDEGGSARLIAMAAVLQRQPDRIAAALAAAKTSRDRQVVEIARAHLDGNADLVDALARDHLVDHPDSLIVAWIASECVERSRGEGRS